MHILYREQKGHSIEENQQAFFHLFKEHMKKFVALLTKEKGKTAINERENNDSDIIRVLYSGYKKNRTILFPYLPVNLFRQIYTKSVKSYKYLNKFTG